MTKQYKNAVAETSARVAADTSESVTAAMTKQYQGTIAELNLQVAELRPPPIKFSFQDSAALTKDRRRRIASDINSFYAYLTRKVGLSIPHRGATIGTTPGHLPPVVSAGSLIQRDGFEFYRVPIGGEVEQVLLLPPQRIDDPGVAQLAYALYLFDDLLKSDESQYEKDSEERTRSFIKWSENNKGKSEEEVREKYLEIMGQSISKWVDHNGTKIPVIQQSQSEIEHSKRVGLVSFASTLLTFYYVSSFNQRKLSVYDFSKEKPEVRARWDKSWFPTKWENFLWSMRDKYGQETMDSIMFAVITTWGTKGELRDGPNLDTRFARQLAYAFEVFGKPEQELQQMLDAAGLGEIKIER
jgi:hypothetical protein